MDLLNAAQHTEIRNALQDVFDTFHDTDVIYTITGDYGDPYMENPKRNESFITIKGMVEYPTDKVVDIPEGVLHAPDVNIQHGLDNMDNVGLINADNLCTINEDDQFETNGEKFRVTSVKVDGPFEQKNIMVLITGRRLVQDK